MIIVFQIAPCAKESSKEEGGRGENSYPSEEGRIGKDGKRSGERASEGRSTGSNDRGEEGEGEEEGRSAVKLVNVLRGGARGGKHLPPGRRGRVPKGGGGGGWLRTCQCEHAINKRPVDSRCSMGAVTRQGKTGYRMVDKGESEATEANGRKRKKPHPEISVCPDESTGFVLREKSNGSLFYTRTTTVHLVTCSHFL